MDKSKLSNAVRNLQEAICDIQGFISENVTAFQDHEEDLEGLSAVCSVAEAAIADLETAIKDFGK